MAIIVFLLTDYFPKSSHTTTPSSTISVSNLEVYKIVYSGSATGNDSNNPIPAVPNEQCSADYPCDNFQKDSATWTWNYIYYYLSEPGVGGDLSAYDNESSTETVTYSASWVAIPAIGDTAYSCSQTSSVISNANYAVPSTGAVFGAVQGANGQTNITSTQYAPWNAMLFQCGITQNGEPALSTPSCAGSYSYIFSIPLSVGTYPESNSQSCPSSDDNGTIGGYAGGGFSWSGSMTVSQGTCNDIPSSVQMLPWLKACLAGTLP